MWKLYSDCIRRKETRGFQVGITKRNIRFYEQQGLLSPKRNMENGYRDYTEEEISELKKIKLLRKLSLPIEEIRRIQNGNLLLEDAMQRQIIVLERERANLAEMSGLCLALSKERCQYPDLSPEQYLERMVEMERNGTRFSNADKQDVIRKKRGSVIAAGAMILFMIFLICLGIYRGSDSCMAAGILHSDTGSCNRGGHPVADAENKRN